MTLLVLGASSDMGMYFIKSTYQRYDKIIAHYRTMNTELNDLGEKIGRDRISLLKADLAVEEDVLAFVNQIRDICDYPSHIIHFPAPPCENNKFHKISWDVF